MRRRVRGEGTVYQRKDGRWCAEAPRPLRRDFYGATAAEAIRKRGAWLKGRTLHGSGTLGAYLAEWLALHVHAVKPRTHERDSGLISKHVLPEIGGVKMAKLAPSHIERVMEGARKTLAPRTVAMIRQLISQALARAVKLGRIGSNPVDLTDAPHVPRSDINVMPEEEVRAWLKYLDGKREYALILAYLTIGSRRGEVLALHWADVDLDARRATLRYTLYRHAGQLVIEEMKTAASYRSVRLPKLLVAALRAWRAVQLADKMKLGPQWTETGLVFTTRTGTPLEPRNVYRTVQTSLTGAKLAKRSVHALRHTAATLLLDRGVPLKLVSEMLGHAGTHITARIYAHKVRGMSDETADAMDDITSG